jgi:hypothetical protein
MAVILLKQYFRMVVIMRVGEMKWCRFRWAPISSLSIWVFIKFKILGKLERDKGIPLM